MLFKQDGMKDVGTACTKDGAARTKLLVSREQPPNWRRYCRDGLQRMCQNLYYYRSWLKNDPCLCRIYTLGIDKRFEVICC